MWVEGGDIQDELLDQLGGVLAPPADLALTPSAAELQALALAVAARWPDQAFAPGAPADAEPDGSGDAVVRRLRWAGPRTRRLGSGAWRAGTAAAGIVVFSASAAAAANGGVPLPRPVRVVAYTVGLPVDSPALDDTHQHIKELNDAVKAKDKPKAEKTAARLQTDLRKVPASEKKEATPKVITALQEAAKTGIIPPPPPAMTDPAVAPTTTTTPSTTAPAPSTTATTVEEKEKEKEKDKDKNRPAVTTTTAPATTTTEPAPTTTTTAPETDEGQGGTAGTDPGDGHSAGTGGDPGTTPTTVPAETTTTTTGPPQETTTTTTTAPEPTTTTTTAPPPQGA